MLELLLAMALVIALAAVALPLVLDNLDERAFESAADVTNEQLMLARAHAQATGEPVEVTYEAKKSQVRARIFVPWLQPPARIGGFDDPPAKAGRGASSGGADEPLVGREIAEPWATRPLSPNVRIVAGNSAAAPNSDLNLNPPHTPQHKTSEGEQTDDPPQTLQDLLSNEDVRLAVFMPDGTALLGDTIWLNDSDGRRGQLIINQWTGLPIFQRLADVDARADQKRTALDSQKKG